MNNKLTYIFLYIDLGTKDYVSTKSTNKIIYHKYTDSTQRKY